MDIDDLPPGLVREFRVGQAAVFAGAGASVDAGLPTWSQLVEELADELGIAETTSTGRLQLSNLTAIPQYYENRFGRKSLTEKLRDAIPRKGTEPSASHQLLADLPCNLYYTTNFDVLLEHALEAAGREFETVSSEEDAKDHSGRETCQVRKIHGSIDTANSLVITRDDFLRYEPKHPHLSERLRTDLATTTFLFVGYSLDDPNFSQLYDRVFLALAPFERRHYMTVFGANHYQVEDLRRRSLEIIDLDLWSSPGTRDGLPQFLTHLCAATSDALHIRKVFTTVTKGDEVPIVLPSHIHPVEGYEYFPRMDFQVARSLDQALSLLGVPTEIYADADVLATNPDAFLAADIVLVGSPRGNTVSEYVFDTCADKVSSSSPLTINFVPGETRQLLVSDGTHTETFTGTDPARFEDEEVHTEYAVIARYSNPWAPRCNLWLIAGLWGLGTQALANLFASGGYRDLDWPADGNALSVLAIQFTREDVGRRPYRHRSIEVVTTMTHA